MTDHRLATSTLRQRLPGRGAGPPSELMEVAAQALQKTASRRAAACSAAELFKRGKLDRVHAARYSLQQLGLVPAAWAANAHGPRAPQVKATLDARCRIPPMAQP